MAGLSPRVQALARSANARARGGRSRAPNKRLANMGAALEDALKAQHDQYRHQGVAEVRYQPTPTKWIGQGSGHKLVFSARSTVDYMGSLADGRAIAIEAKSSQGRFSLNDRKRGLKAHQLDFLRGWPGLGLLVLRFKGVDAVTLAVGVEVLLEAIDSGVKGWSRKAALEVGVQLDGVNWLAALPAITGAT